MRESRLYINFFLKNAFLLGILTFTLALIGGYYISFRPVLYNVTREFEMEYNNQNVLERVTLTDEAVSLLRAVNINKSLNLNQDSRLTVFKPGPLNISLTVLSKDRVKALSDTDKGTSFLIKKFPLNKIGLDSIGEEKGNILTGILFGGIVGFIIGLLSALIKSYLQNF